MHAVKGLTLSDDTSDAARAAFLARPQRFALRRGVAWGKGFAMVRRILMSAVLLAVFGGILAQQSVLLGRKQTTSSNVASITLDQAAPRVGDTITFTTVYPAAREVVRIAVVCKQDLSIVWQSQQAVPATFTLSGGWWYGGAADCTARLFYFTYKGNEQVGIEYLAETAFTVAP